MITGVLFCKRVLWQNSVVIFLNLILNMILLFVSFLVNKIGMIVLTIHCFSPFPSDENHIVHAILF